MRKWESLKLRARMNKWFSKEEEEEACSFALQLCTASAVQAALRCAMDLDLLELIKKAGPAAFVSATELAAQINAANPEAHLMIDRILRLLAANNILNCRHTNGGGERLYSLAPVCNFLTKNEDDVSLAPLFFLNHDSVFIQTWYHMKDAVVGGIPFERAHGTSAFEYMGTDPRFRGIFNDAMAGHSTILMKKILEIYKGFEGVKCLVDVAGGIGSALKMIVSEFQSIKAINFDLPHVIDQAPPHIGVEHVSGDMFASVPQGDAIFMKWICHDWGDDECLRLLKNCYEALPCEGKVIMVERIVSKTPNKEACVDLSFDVIMLSLFGSGKERTEIEFEALGKAAGFKDFRKVACAFGFWIMEFYK